MNLASILESLKRYPLAVVCSGLLLICVILIVLRGSVVADLSTRESELSARIRTIEGNARNAVDLEEDVEKLETQVSLIDGRLFDRDERAINTNFFYSFEEEIAVVVSSVSQLTVEDPVLSAGGPNELKLHSAISYDLRVRGSFRGILSFLHEIHRVDPIVRVSSLQLDGANGDLSGDLTAKLRVLVLANKN